MSQPNSIPAPRDSSPHLITPTNTPPPSATQMHQPYVHHQQHSHPLMENFPDHRQHLLAIFSQGTHSFCQEEREEPVVERRKSFAEQSYPTPPGSRRPSFLSGLTLSRPFAFTSQPASGASTPVHSTSPTAIKDHFPIQPKSTAMTPSSSSDKQRSMSMPASPVVAGNAVAKKKVNGFEGEKAKLGEDRRHFDPSREPRLLHLL